MQLTLDVETPRLLKQLPHFFQSLSSALAELIQNSWRSGATTIDFALLPSIEDASGWELIIRDDGPGVTDPATLFTAGRTDWDTTHVIDPAGLGFFALLGLSETLAIESHAADGSGWRTQVTANAFDGHPFSIESLPSTPPGASGLTLIAALKPEADVNTLQRNLAFFRQHPDLAEALPPWRHAFPLTVRWTDTTQTNVIPPRLPLAPDWPALSTPAGLLYNSTSHDQSHSFQVVWEHRVIPVDRRDLTHAITTVDALLAPEILDALPHCLTWILPATTAVRPQLPERSAIIADTAWHEALTALATALIQAYDASRLTTEIAAITPSFPSVLNEPPIHYFTRSQALNDLPSTSVLLETLRKTVAVHPLFSLPTSTWLRYAGYTLVNVPDFLNTEGDWTEGGEGESPLFYRLWMRNQPWTADPTLADVLNWHGLWTLPQPCANQPERTLQVVQAQWGPDRFDEWLELGRCQRIDVLEGTTVIHTIPWIVQIDPQTATRQLLIADDPQGSALSLYPPTESLSHQQLVLPIETELPIAYLLSNPHNLPGQSCDLWDYADIDDNAVSFWGLLQTMATTAQSWWAPDAYAQRLAYDETKRRINNLQNAKSNLIALSGWLPPSPSTTAAIATLEASIVNTIHTLNPNPDA